MGQNLETAHQLERQIMLELYQHPGCSGWLGGVSGHEHPAPISWEFPHRLR